MTRGRLVALRPVEVADPPPDIPDDAVIAGCAAGERAARALLFERHFDAVYRFVARMRGSDRDSVEDVVQTTFLAAFRAAPRYRGGNARAWLFGIAANLTRELARREIRRKRALGAVADLPPPRSLEASERHLLARLRDAAGELPHDLRAAFVLVDLEGERGSDAAAALGIPEGTLWRRVFLARKQLRATLAGGDS